MTASAEAVGLAELGDTGSESAALVVANGVAMEAAVALADHLDGDAILAMHKALLGSTEPESAGKWRTVQNNRRQRLVAARGHVRAAPPGPGPGGDP